MFNLRKEQQQNEEPYWRGRLSQTVEEKEDDANCQIFSSHIRA